MPASDRRSKCASWIRSRLIRQRVPCVAFSAWYCRWRNWAAAATASPEVRFRVEHPGLLFLGICDHSIRDNSGELAVDVEVRSPTSGR